MYVSHVDMCIYFVHFVACIHVCMIRLTYLFILALVNLIVTFVVK